MVRKLTKMIRVARRSASGPVAQNENITPASVKLGNVALPLMADSRLAAMADRVLDERAESAQLTHKDPFGIAESAPPRGSEERSYQSFTCALYREL